MGNLQHKVSILQKEWLTHNVIRFRLEKPSGFEFIPAQAIELTLNKRPFPTDAAPFTLTGLCNDSFLELMLKVYPMHNGITLGLSQLNPGDRLLIGDAWDSFQYKGPGVFIAGGTGITPFIAILRDLNSKGATNEQTLLFANRSEKDIFLKEDLSAMKGLRFFNVLSQEKVEGFGYGRIDKGVLATHISNFKQTFYLCGPASFSSVMKQYLIELGTDESNILNEY